MKEYQLIKLERDPGFAYWQEIATGRLCARVSMDDLTKMLKVEFEKK
jgi:hypothetical protein